VGRFPFSPKADTGQTKKVLQPCADAQTYSTFVGYSDFLADIGANPYSGSHTIRNLEPRSRLVKHLETIILDPPAASNFCADHLRRYSLGSP
jgi:hypothetical protein